MDTEVADILYPKMDYYVHNTVMDRWLEIEGAVGPAARKAMDSGSHEGRRAQDALLRISGRIDSLTDDVVRTLAVENRDPSEVTGSLVEELRGLRSTMNTITWNDRAANARALRAIDNIIGVLRWENIEPRVLS